MSAKTTSRQSVLSSLKSRWKTSRRLKQFTQYIDSLPPGDHPEERVIPYRSPVDDRKQRLYVSSADYRCMLIDRHTQDHKIKEFFKLVSEGGYQQYVDIGANYGEFVTGSLSAASHTLAIEANPIVARCLRRSFRDHKQVKVIDRAVSASNEILQMRINPQYSGGNRLVEEGNETPEYFLDDSSFILDVPCQKLSEVLNTELIDQQRVAIKMDVEGHESVLIEELLEWLDLQRTEQLLLMFEYNANSEHAFDRLMCQVERLVDLDFELSTICSRKVDFTDRERYSSENWREAFKQTCEVILERKA